MAFLQLEAEILQLASFCTAAACVAASAALIAAGFLFNFCAQLASSSLDLLLRLSSLLQLLPFAASDSASAAAYQQLLWFWCDFNNSLRSCCCSGLLRLNLHKDK
ncbi:hypothetical protein M9H77_13926 [Catharanthus roseus]|uniref:Uncharacterized protein n=1 Tax=Catharanthus roseus TaxID=4058 RepID=A0ACC0BLS9_CATRO|nr:hypothetical protein M9H77_13926 [Catharanthus roseus]